MTMVTQARPPQAATDLPDEELARRIRQKDELALRQAVAEHGGRVLAIARRTIRDPARAEEVAQDTFVALWTRPEAFDARRGSLRSFLSGIAHHKAVDEVRKQSVRDRATGRLLEEEGFLVESSSTKDADTGAEIRHAIKGLSPKLRDTLFLAYYVGLTYREVAIELGIPEGTAKSRIRDALHHLRCELGVQAEA
jgi:RNA polymerase sigma-70 factor (ECF subfamily)